MKGRRNGFTFTELIITMAVMGVFMLFFVNIFQVIIKALQINKQLSSRMYAEAQLENAFSVIARELQWGGSLYGNLATATLAIPGQTTVSLTQFGSPDFVNEAATKTVDGKTLKIKYAQIEKGILKKLSAYQQYNYVKFCYEASYTASTLPATLSASKVYFSYIGGSNLNLGNELYYPTGAKVWVFSMDSLESSSPTTLTYWEPTNQPSTTFFSKYNLDYFKLSSTDTSNGCTILQSTPTGLSNKLTNPLGDFLLTLAYQFPESLPYLPNFKGISMGGTRNYYGEMISKTTFEVTRVTNEPKKLIMQKYIPTVSATATLFKQTLFEPILDATFSVLENRVVLDLVYSIPDPANKGRTINYNKKRVFWTFGVGQ